MTDITFTKDEVLSIVECALNSCTNQIGNNVVAVHFKAYQDTYDDIYKNFDKIRKAIDDGRNAKIISPLQGENND